MAGIRDHLQHIALNSTAQLQPVCEIVQRTPRMKTIQVQRDKMKQIIKFTLYKKICNAVDLKFFAWILDLGHSLTSKSWAKIGIPKQDG